MNTVETTSVSPHSSNALLPAVANRKLRPILFSTPMVQAILEGRKTQTRRTKGFAGVTNVYGMSDDKTCVIADFTTFGIDIKKSRVLAPYQIGDVLWVRESFMKYQPGRPFIYKTEVNEKQLKSGAFKFKPSIHMPYEACRLWLKITNIRAERLQEITEADAKAEGVDVSWMYASATVDSVEQKKKFGSAYVGGFAALWCHINGAQSWDENPFVWVIEFERCSKP